MMSPRDNEGVAWLAWSMPLEIQLCLLMSPPSRLEWLEWKNSSGKVVHMPAKAPPNLDSLVRGTAPLACVTQQGTLGRQGRESCRPLRRGSPWVLELPELSRDKQSHGEWKPYSLHSTQGLSQDAPSWGASYSMT